MAVLALDATPALQLRIQSVPVPICQNSRESPTNLLRDVIEAVIDRIGVGVITRSMTLETGLAIVPQLTINAFFENLCMGRHLPRVVFIFSDVTAAVAKRAGIRAQILRRGDIKGKVGGTFLGSCD